MSEMLESSKMALLTGADNCTVEELCEAVGVEESDLKEFITGVGKDTDLAAKGVFCGFEHNEAVVKQLSEWLQMEPEVKEAVAEVEAGGAEFNIDEVINGLCDMFKEKNGRDPTEDEIKVRRRAGLLKRDLLANARLARERKTLSYCSFSTANPSVHSDLAGAAERSRCRRGGGAACGGEVMERPK